MATAKNLVTIKGVKDGLIFVFNDQCTFEEVMQELRYKLEKTHQNILTGPLIHVNIKLGNRIITLEQEQEIRKLIKKKGNLIIQSIQSDPLEKDSSELDPNEIKIYRGIVRSGQTIYHSASILYLGDINPGGTIVSDRDIYIMGSLKGMAHAGANGDSNAVIVASYLRPTQLRIADVISRPPDEWGIDEAYMEFAYLKNGTMEIDKIVHLHKIRPGAMEIKGE